MRSLDGRRALGLLRKNKLLAVLMIAFMTASAFIACSAARYENEEGYAAAAEAPEATAQTTFGSRATTAATGTTNQMASADFATEEAEDSEEGDATQYAQPKASDTYKANDYSFDWKSGRFISVKLNGSAITASGTGITVKGSTATISASGTYEISGKLIDGSIVVNVDKSTDKGTVYLVLNNAEIASKTSAPIYIMEGKKVVMLLADGSTNSVAQGSGVIVNADEEPSAAIFSKADLTITGKGKLTVIGDYNDGITSKDDLVITAGIITVKAASDGIVGKDSVSVAGGSITVDAGKDGIRSTNDEEPDKGNIVIHGGTFVIKAANDGIQAYNVVDIQGGDFDITTGGGYPGKSTTSGNEAFGKPGMKPFSSQTTATVADEESKKAVKAGQLVVISGGEFAISAYDDAIHSNTEIMIKGGVIELKTGDDAMHADSRLTIQGGQINVSDSYEGLEGAYITIDGGKMVLNASDDGINVNSNSGVLTINGGIVHIVAGGDGADSNGSIVMTGGTVYVDGPTQNMNGSLDYNRDFKVTGGVMVASGSSGMAQAPGTSSTQASILMYYSNSQAAGTAIVLKDAKGNTVVSFTPTKAYSSVAITSPDLKTGSTYCLYSGNNKVVDVTLSTMVTYLSEAGIMTGAPEQEEVARYSQVARRLKPPR